ncbi:hypothetical protein D3C84_603560 [compost metagenome]
MEKIIDVTRNIQIVLHHPPIHIHMPHRRIPHKTIQIQPIHRPRRVRVDPSAQPRRKVAITVVIQSGRIPLLARIANGFVCTTLIAMVFTSRAAKGVKLFAALHPGVFIQFQRPGPEMVGQVVTQRMVGRIGAVQPLHSIASGLQVEHFMLLAARTMMDLQPRQIAHFGNHGTGGDQCGADFAQAFASAAVEVAFGVVVFVFAHHR